MKRLIYQHLIKWKSSSTKKPLILRGARQVGKTSVIRKFSQEYDSFVEINFEQNTNIHKFFNHDLDPHTIIENIELLYNVKITPGKTLLFFDETQACPRAILALRYFFEGIPELDVIAAGSLLDFAIDQIGVPVGRVEFMYMYPMSFIEFLWASKQDQLANLITSQSPSNPINDAIHQKVLKLFGEYIAIGGMPEAVNSWVNNRDYKGCLKIHHNLVLAYEQDFPKYAATHQLRYIDVLFKSIPFQSCARFKYTNVGEYRSRELAPCLDLLCKAGIAKKVHHTAARGFPLGAQSQLDTFKVLLLDVALSQAILGQTAEQWIIDAEEAFINNGDMAEALIGQELIAYSDPHSPSQLYYWQKQGRGAEAELDYIIANKNKVTPVEVKAGKGTSMKSMRVFLSEHEDSPFGIRFSTHNYSVYEGIHSYPLYSASSLYLTTET